MKEITTEKWEEVSDYINKFYRTSLNGDVVRECVAGNIELEEEIRTGGYTDTAEREHILQCVCDKYLGMQWPTFGDTTEYTVEFFAEAIKYGIVKGD